MSVETVENDLGNEHGERPPRCYILCSENCAGGKGAGKTRNAETPSAGGRGRGLSRFDCPIY